MNKQELINELTKYVERYEDATDKYDQGKSSAYEVALKLAKKLRLDEPQKPVMPKFAAEYLNYCIRNEWTLAEALNSSECIFPEDNLEKASVWLEDSMNQNIFAQAWLFGYEIKEPLYYVKIPSLAYDMFLVKGEDGELIVFQNTSCGTKFTEAEIKAIDERFWPFAVPVEEVAEG